MREKKRRLTRLARASVDWVVSDDYCVRPVQAPIVVFAIDCNCRIALQAAVHAARAEIAREAHAFTDAGEAALEWRARTYGVVAFGESVQFFKVSHRPEAEPGYVVVSDLAEPFVPRQRPTTVFAILREGFESGWRLSVRVTC